MPPRRERNLAEIIASGGLRAAIPFAAALFGRGGALASRLGSIFTRASRATLNAFARVARNAVRAARDIEASVIGERLPISETPLVRNHPSSRIGRERFEVVALITITVTHRDGTQEVYSRRRNLQFSRSPSLAEIHDRAGRSIGLVEDDRFNETPKSHVYLRTPTLATYQTAVLGIIRRE